MQPQDPDAEHERAGLDSAASHSADTQGKPGQAGTPPFAEVSDTLVFYLNDAQIAMRNPSPTLMLADFLRSSEIGLTGTKLACREGGCGACTVMLSFWDRRRQREMHTAVQSCLLPICALAGKAVTTTEGLGSIKQRLHPVQHRIVQHNGAQCGFCTPGWVMAATALLTQHREHGLTGKQLCERIDGNLCRCTGYRPLLYALKTLASDADAAEAAGTPDYDIDVQPRVPISDVTVRLADALKQPPEALFFEHDGDQWHRPTTLAQLSALRQRYHSLTTVKLVAGNSAAGLATYQSAGDDQSSAAHTPMLFIDIAAIDELNQIELQRDRLAIGGAVTVARLIDYLETALEQTPNQGLAALKRMAEQIGNMQIRNVASLAGNIMLVVRRMDSPDPFVSDLFTTLAALNAQLVVSSSLWGETSRRLSLDAFVEYYRRHAAEALDLLIMSILVPLSAEHERVRAWKVARRRQNAGAIVNAAFSLTVDAESRIQQARIVYGGISAPIFRAEQTEALLAGRDGSAQTLREALVVLGREVEAQLTQEHVRREQLAREGIDPGYCAALAINLFYKCFQSSCDPALSDEADRFGAEDLPVAQGRQKFDPEPSLYPLTQPLISSSSLMQATGEAMFLQDLPLPSNGLEAQFVYSLCALGRFHYRHQGQRVTDPERRQQLIADLRGRFPGFVDLVTADDIPDPRHQLIGYGQDDPVLCAGEVTAYGQPIAVAVARSLPVAQQAARYIQTECIVYEPPVDEARQPIRPILSIDEALALPGGVGMLPNPAPRNPGLRHLERIERQDSATAWLDDPATLPPGSYVVTGQQRTPAQLHFYLETQTALAIPQEGHAIEVYASTQSPHRIQQCVANVLGLVRNNVTVHASRVGGGFGGKTTRSWFIAAAASIAAWKLQRPVRLLLTRPTDSLMIGKRHPFLGRYWAAFDQTGMLKGLRTDLWVDAGHAYDNAPMTVDVALLAADNCYKIPNFRVNGRLCRTNKPSNTSMRGFGAFQAILIQEEAIEHVAYTLGVRPETIRELNMYADASAAAADSTPYGQRLGDCSIRAVWQELKTWCDFEQRAAAVDLFNSRHRWRKRGIAMMPLKYGKSFELPTPNQADALIQVYATDGSVLVHTGGVEIGQGLSATLAGLTAQALNIPVANVRVAGVNTANIANATTTGADSGLILNGNAVASACASLRARLEDFCRQLLHDKGQTYCVEQGINYWDYADGWSAKAAIRRQVGRVDTLSYAWDAPSLIWCNIVGLAYRQRVDLSARAHFEMPGLTALTDDRPYGVPYCCFTYSASAVEVEIDVLTGELAILRADILHDVGRALNPAAVIGQIEGGFVQGVGALTTEEVVYQQDGPAIGRLNTANTWTYKLPTPTSIPLDLRVRLYAPTDRTAPPDPRLPHQARPTGQSGVLLAIPVFFAIKHAILAARHDRGVHEWPELDPPATVQQIQTACRVDLHSLIP